MAVREKLLVAWSGGKDSALALYRILAIPRYEIAAILSTVTDEYDRVSMHGVRTKLLEEQGESLGYPLEQVPICKNATNGEYESAMRRVLERYQAEGVSAVVFGDIFLADVRKYREEHLRLVGMRGIFPLWGEDTGGLARTFIALGFKAVTTCVDSTRVSKEFVGRAFNLQYLSELPPTVDPCGENGEFHSFVYDGPIFRKPIRFKQGNVVLRDNRFYYCDLIPPAPDGGGSSCQREGNVG
jgi:uncharacterized protein (TIGR00290 family)